MRSQVNSRVTFTPASYKEGEKAEYSYPPRIKLTPEMVGPLAESLRNAHVPVVLCTGYETVDDIRLEGCALIRKPANVRQLLAGIENAMKAA